MNNLLSVFRDIPMLETSRLILRRLLVRDSKDMYEYASKSIVTKYLTWSCHESESDTKKYLKYLQGKYRKGEYYDWAIVQKEKDKMIGTCGFTDFDIVNNSAEIGYVISDQFWGNAYAPEAVGEIIRFGFEKLFLNRIEARHMIGNDKSGRVMQKCGMEYEGTLRSSMYVKDEYKTIVVYSILKNNYFKTE